MFENDIPSIQFNALPLELRGEAKHYFIWTIALKLMEVNAAC